MSVRTPDKDSFLTAYITSKHVCVDAASHW